MMQRLYRVLTILATPLIALYLERRRWAGKEDPERFPERLGRAGAERPEGAQHHFRQGRVDVDRVGDSASVGSHPDGVGDHVNQDRRRSSG